MWGDHVPKYYETISTKHLQKRGRKVGGLGTENFDFSFVYKKNYLISLKNPSILEDGVYSVIASVEEI